MRFHREVVRLVCLFKQNKLQELHIICREHSNSSVDLSSPPSAFVLTSHTHLLTLTQRKFIRIFSCKIVQDSRIDSPRFSRRRFVHVHRNRCRGTLRGERTLLLSTARECVFRGSAWGGTSERSLSRGLSCLGSSAPSSRILVVLFVLVVATSARSLARHGGGAREIGVVVGRVRIEGLDERFRRHSLVGRGGLELGHALRHGGEELLLHRAQGLELVGEVGGSRRFVLDELVDQTVGDAGEGRLALLELILVLDVMGGGWGDSDDLVGIGVRLGAKLFQLEVVVIVVHLRLLSDLDCVLWFKRRGEQTSRGFISASFCFRRATISSLIRFILDQ